MNILFFSIQIGMMILESESIEKWEKNGRRMGMLIGIYPIYPLVRGSNYQKQPV
jgi:hypothetical protein